MNYRYVAVQADNQVVQGMLQAGNDRSAEQILTRSGLRAIELKQVRGLLPSGLRWQGSKASRKDLLLFAQQLATLIGTGMPLLSAIELLREQARNATFARELDSVLADLRSGSALHTALEKSKTFPVIFVRMVEAGERSGTLETVLRHLASYLQKEIATAALLKKALTYPAIVVVVAIVVVGILVTMVLPTIAEMLKSFDAKMPLLTRLLLGGSDFLQHWKLQLLGAMIGLTWFAVWYARSEAGKYRVAAAILAAPVLGRLVAARNLARFSRTMSLLLGAGLPITECLAQASEGTTNPVFRKAPRGVRESALNGRGLGAGFAVIPYMPRLYTQMIKAGEESGSLAGNLSSMADFYERETEEEINTLTTLIEPAITIGLGIVTAAIALSVMLPMLQLMKSIPGA